MTGLPTVKHRLVMSAVEKADQRDVFEVSTKPGLEGGARLPAPAASVLPFGLLLLTYVLAFAKSLQGGSHGRDLNFITAHMSVIGLYIVVCAAAFTAALWLTIAARGPLLAWRWRGRAALLAANLGFLAYDHGGDFQFHGYYNWLMLWLIAVPLNAVLGGLWLWYRALPLRRFLGSLAAAAAVLAVSVTVPLIHYRHLASQGFLGARMLPGCVGPRCGAGTVRECSFPPSLPWVDLLPGGAQNFWTGSQHCVSSARFKSSLSDGGRLVVHDCPGGAEYCPLPQTRGWAIERKSHYKAAYQTNVLKEMKWEAYREAVTLTAESVLVRCGKEEQLHVRVQPLPKFAPPAASAAPVPQPRGRLNLLVMFIDSVSRRHFFRRMPKTVAAMEAMHRAGDSRLSQFFRFHGVGFHTLPNTRALYSGTNLSESKAEPFWTAYRGAGYVTASSYNLCEDWGADYDALSSRLDHELVSPFCLPEYHPVTPDGEPYKIFQGAFSILRRCLAGRHVHEYNFDYARAFVRTYDGAAPWLLMNSFHEGHEGTGEVLATVDADMAAFLGGLSRATLDRTAVMVIADHGLTMGLNFLYTPNGRIEHKNPMLALMMPAWVEAERPEVAAGLAANEQRLVSAYDVFTTFHHLLHFGDPPPPAGERPAAWAAAGNVSATARWGASLLAPVPEGRNCDDTGVPPDTCFCEVPGDRVKGPSG